MTVLDSIVWRYQNARENMEQSTGVTAMRLPRLSTCALLLLLVLVVHAAALFPSALVCHYAFADWIGRSALRSVIGVSRVVIAIPLLAATRALILPGATLADDSALAAGSLLTKNGRVPQGKTFGGVPARELVRS